MTVWRDRHARTLLASILLSSVGMGVYVLALGQMLFSLTGNAQAFAMILTLQGIGAICVLPFSGPLVDALSSKRVYVACGLGRAATVLAIVLVGMAGTPASVPLIGGAALVLAVFDNMQRAAMFKFSARHIDNALRVRVNGLLGVAIQGGALGGMALLGLILVVATPAHALLVDVVMSCAAAAVMASIQLDVSDGTGALSGTTLRSAVPSALRDWRRMLGQYRDEVVVFGMVALCAADFVFAYSLSTLVVPLVDRFYGGQSWYISALEATFGVGMIVASAFTRRTVKQQFLPAWLAIQAGMALLLSASHDPVAHFIAFFIAGFANLNSLTWLLTTLQQHAADTDKAKMASLRLLAIGAGTIVLMPLIGFVSRTSLDAAFVSVAVIMTVFAAGSVWIAVGFRPRATAAFAAGGHEHGMETEGTYMTNQAKAVHQVRRPRGVPVADDFTFVHEPMPDPVPGTALVENVFLSVDPYMRECMDGLWQLNASLEGRSIGRVVASQDAQLAVGDLVFHRKGWRTHALVSAEEVRILPRLDRVPLSHWLSVLGGTGLTAYIGLTKVAKLRAGESIYISAAAGGVGSAAAQISRLLGAGRMIGSTGSAAKVTHLLTDLGFDAAFDYHDEPIGDQLAKAAPDGIDVYFDNVGGDHLEAAIDALRNNGRIAWCGAVAQYSTAPPPAPRNLYEVVGKSLRLEGFLVRNNGHLQGELEEFLVPHIQSGRLVPSETIVEGFDQVVDAFLGVLGGRNAGKMIVRVESATH